MVAIRDSSYIFQSILVKGNTLACFYLFFIYSPMKRYCPFNIKLFFKPTFMLVVILYDLSAHVNSQLTICVEENLIFCSTFCQVSTMLDIAFSFGFI